MDDLIYVGKISSTHRLLGTLKVSTSFYLLEELLYKTVIIKKENDLKLFKIDKIKGFNGKRALIDFEKINNINLAKEILGYSIYIHRNLLPEYEEEITVVDYEVFDKNEYIGKVIDIMETSAHDILVIEGVKEILVPFIDVFVKNIDDDNKRIDLDLIEGFL